MGTCDVCGNTYDKTFTVTQGERTRTFDSLECAVSDLALPCDHCGCRILGHGVEADDRVYCCASCARMAGEHRLADRA